MMGPVMSSPNLRDRRKQETHAALTRAAAEVFSRRGFAHATIDEVAAEAGVSRATVYLHFPAKEDLARAVIDNLRQRAAEWIDGEHGSTDVTSLVRSWVEFFRSELDAFRVWHDADAIDPTIEAPIRVTGSAVVERLLGVTVTDAAPEADVVAIMMFAQLERLLHGWLIQGWELDEEVIVREVARAWNEYFIPRLRTTIGA